jgi:type IV pilus assembly protein PilV
VAQTPRKAGRALQRGLLLIEALTAILLFSAGVLGTIALHAQAIRHIDEAQSRGEAIHLADSLIARMWADDPGSLAERYASAPGGPGFREFSTLALRLPGAAMQGNGPEVRVVAGPSASSRTVTVTLHWQMPGDAQSHRYAASATIGRN